MFVENKYFFNFVRNNLNAVVFFLVSYFAFYLWVLLIVWFKP